MSAADEPDFTPRFTLEITFPVGSSEEELIEGHGMNVMMTSSHLGQGDRIHALLRVAEALVADDVREAFAGRDTMLAPPIDDEVQDTLVALNARTAAIAILASMSLTPQEAFGISIPDSPTNEGDHHA